MGAVAVGLLAGAAPQFGVGLDPVEPQPAERSEFVAGEFLDHLELAVADHDPGDVGDRAEAAVDLKDCADELADGWASQIKTWMPGLIPGSSPGTGKTEKGPSPGLLPTHPDEGRDPFVRRSNGGSMDPCLRRGGELGGSIEADGYAAVAPE